MWDFEGFQLTFFCHLDLADFPFDSHQCNMEYGENIFDANYVNLEVGV